VKSSDELIKPSTSKVSDNTTSGGPILTKKGSRRVKLTDKLERAKYSTSQVQKPSDSQQEDIGLEHMRLTSKSSTGRGRRVGLVKVLSDKREELKMDRLKSKTEILPLTEENLKSLGLK